jgi:hypothetical protein
MLGREPLTVIAGGRRLGSGTRAGVTPTTAVWVSVRCRGRTNCAASPRFLKHLEAVTVHLAPRRRLDLDPARVLSRDVALIGLLRRRYEICLVGPPPSFDTGNSRPIENVSEPAPHDRVRHVVERNGRQRPLLIARHPHVEPTHHFLFIACELKTDAALIVEHAGSDLRAPLSRVLQPCRQFLERRLGLVPEAITHGGTLVS